MKWAAGTKDSVTGRPYFFQSDCGRYTVTIPIGEATVYIAYRKPPPNTKEYARMLGGFESSKEAKAACELDASKHQVGQRHDERLDRLAAQ